MPLEFRKYIVLKLKKALYSLRQSPLSFWKCLTNQWRHTSWKFLKLIVVFLLVKKVFLICYVDSILFWTNDKANINKVSMALYNKGLRLEQKDHVTHFLGVHLTNTKDGIIKMEQTGLIDGIIEILGLNSRFSTSKLTPVEATPLIWDWSGEPPQVDFSCSLLLVGWSTFLDTYMPSHCLHFELLYKIHV